MGRGIDFNEALVQLARGKAGEFRAQGEVCRRHIGEAVGECLEVETGTARDDWDFAARKHFGNLFARQGREPSSVKGLGGCEKSDQMMRDGRQRLRGGLAGQDLHPAIDLIGVRSNNFAVEPPGEVDGEGGLADPSRASDDDGKLAIQVGADRHAFPRRLWLRLRQACGPCNLCREAL